jgi:hypothetical protein
MPIAQYIQEYQDFSVGLIESENNKCIFCGEEKKKVYCFFLLTYKAHKKDKIFLLEDKKRYYVVCCQQCMQYYVKIRTQYIHNLSLKDVPYLQYDVLLEQELSKLLDNLDKYNVMFFKHWCDGLLKEASDASFVANPTNNAVLQILPGVAKSLSQAEISYAVARIQQYQAEFMFNASSDYMLLMQLVLMEINLQRLQSKLLSFSSEEKGRAQAKNELLDVNKEYRETLKSLGLLRSDRDKIGGANIAEISALVDTEANARLEIQEWDAEVEAKLIEKQQRENN